MASNVPTDTCRVCGCVGGHHNWCSRSLWVAYSPTWVQHSNELRERREATDAVVIAAREMLWAFDMDDHYADVATLSAAEALERAIAELDGES
jgi:hypothetical protein